MDDPEAHGPSEPKMRKEVTVAKCLEKKIKLDKERFKKKTEFKEKTQKNSNKFS